MFCSRALLLRLWSDSHRPSGIELCFQNVCAPRPGRQTIAATFAVLLVSHHQADDFHIRKYHYQFARNDETFVVLRPFQRFVVCALLRRQSLIWSRHCVRGICRGQIPSDFKGCPRPRQRSGRVSLRLYLLPLLTSGGKCAVDPEGCLCTGFCPPENGICSDGACESLCMLPEIGCGFDCVDASSDPENCGGCDIACPPETPDCIGGACLFICLPPDLECNGACVDPATDPSNCGDCGIVVCPLTCCRDGWSLICVLFFLQCPQDDACCNGVCTHVQTCHDACGACDIVCEEGEVCTAGLCQEPACPPGQVECDGVCTDPNTDPNNCGACGTVCPEGEPCVDGVCQVEECPPGETDCDGTCVDTTTDPTNCGACGVAVSTPAAVCFVIPKLIVGSARRERLVSTGPAN
ncbi:putative extracellular cysteine-rich protein [Aspergillus fumigatus Af293]|uniref:Extracellular cysteine-rich protein, putative n=2 Tax=Aspergillus fumigatus TaxID=746128 RepID=Q4WAE0_ASPFU|nr:extracellular cysteine-rich protein, putative [Aspergillus fumigatus Af293]EAL84796.1 extracellular cysteine-rich protein, putative [Aspergillus fumigatus Af293]EDP48044.1 extracellular cysteine-rich protein, putative [Aspergillus fumigatus A1163]